MRRIILLALVAGVAIAGAQPKPKRINKAIELLEQGQPIYYDHGHGGYEEGLKAANTWADYINYEMEHGAFDFHQLREFMRGLVKGGPTKSGHRTPAVIVTVPVGGIDELTVRANYWVFQQTLAAGAHGILFCHSRTPEAVRRFVEAVRFPFHKIGVNTGDLGEGLRGSGSERYAQEIWGVSQQEYLEKADVWPLNPNGEILLGLKIEDKWAVANAESVAKVPGIAFAEWGGGDLSFSFGYKKFPGMPLPPEMAKARERVWAACKAAKLYRLESLGLAGVKELIDDGIMVISAGSNPAEVDKGRRLTKRKMPW